MAHFEKTVSEETVYSCRVFTVKKRSVFLENGNYANRDLVIHNGGACILPMDSDGNVYFVRQYRAPFNMEILELPAGKLEKNEEPIKAAGRELGEETGFTAEKIVSLGEFWPSVGYCSEIIYLFAATGLKPGEVHPDEDEFVTAEKIPFKTAYKMCANGEISDGKTIRAIFRAKEIFNL